MNKLNNKGLSVVEFIVVFVILMVLVFGMMNSIMGLKDSNNTTNISKELLEYKSTLTKVINDDLIKRKFKEIKKCDTLGYSVTCNLSFEDETTSTLIINTNTNEEGDYVISYNNQNYPIPNSEFLEFYGSITVKIDEETKNFLLINIPIYEIDKRDVNYGINIIHPIGLS